MAHKKLLTFVLAFALTGLPSSPVASALPGGGKAHASWLIDAVCHRPQIIDYALLGTATIEMVIAYLLGERRVRGSDGRIPSSAKAAKMLKWAKGLTIIGAAQIATEMVLTYIDNHYCDAYENRPLWWWPSDWDGDD